MIDECIWCISVQLVYSFFVLPFLLRSHTECFCLRFYMFVLEYEKQLKIIEKR